MNDFVIQATGLTRYFGRKCAVDRVSFNIPRGCIAALLGRNGSGKTTLLRMLVGLLEPTAGSSTILDYDSQSIPAHLRRRIAYVAEGHPLYGWLTIRQLAAYQARFYPSWKQSLFDMVIGHFQLDSSSKTGSLSRGQQAGVALALALAPEPELLVLDDPSLGLDPVARRAILEMILRVCAGGERTVLLSTHELQDVDRIADRVLILDQSRLVADAEKDTLLAHIQEFILEPADAASPTPPGLLSSRRDGDTLRLIIANPDEQTRTILAAAGNILDQRDVSLEDGVIAYLSRRGAFESRTQGRKAGAA